MIFRTKRQAIISPTEPKPDRAAIRREYMVPQLEELVRETFYDQLTQQHMLDMIEAHDDITANVSLNITLRPKGKWA
jgi:hypothetical protein